MSAGHEVKANLPGPLSQLSVLPSHDSVQLIGPGATIWHLTENLIGQMGRQIVECKILGKTEMNDQRGKKEINKFD